MGLYSFLKSIAQRITGEVPTETLVARGMKVGTDFSRQQGCYIDPTHCFLIEIGSNVTMSIRVTLMAHDASTKKSLGYTKIGRVTIGNNVFIGAETVVLPGVTIGDNVIIGANSTVTHDIPSGMVAVGSPARVIGTTEAYIAKEKARMADAPCYGDDYTLRKNVSIEKRMKQKNELLGKIGYID